MPAGARGLPATGASRIDDLHRRLIRLHHVVPEPERDEDVRRHVLGVAGRGRDLGIRARGPQPQRRVDGVVIGVNQIVRRARVIWMIAEHRLDDRRGSHVESEVAPGVGGAEQRERVKCRGVGVVRIRTIEIGHRVRIREIARLFVGVAVEDLDGAEVVLLALRLRPCDARLARRRQPRQRFPRGAAVLLHPHGMVVGHRLAPVGHGEVGIDLLRTAKQIGRRGIFEVVELREAGEKAVLGGGRAGISK